MTSEMILYGFFYVTAFVLAFVSVAIAIHEVRHPEFVGDTFRFRTSNFFKIFLEQKDKLKNKKSSILIYLAQKGFVKIRQDENKRIYIDKLMSFENIDAFKDTMDSIFSGELSYYGDEDAIMSYESVAWGDIKNKFSDLVDKELARENADNKNAIIKTTTIDKEMNILLLILWFFSMMPVAISHAVHDSSDGWASAFALYFILGILYCLVIAVRKLIKVVKNIHNLYNTGSGTISTIFVIACMAAQLILYFVIAMLFIFLLALFAACGDFIVDSPLSFNSYLEVILLITTAILLFIKYTYKKRTVTKTKYLIDFAFRKKNLIEADSREERERAALYAGMFNKTSEFKRYKLKDEVPEWYEGDDWKGINGLMKQLDKYPV